MKEPTVIACLAIVETLGMGSATDGQGDNWRNKSTSFHLAKGVRHGMTALMIEMGIYNDDGENHIALAITRFSMALCVCGRPF